MKEWEKRNQRSVVYLTSPILWIQAAVLIAIAVEAKTAIMKRIDMIDCPNIREEL